MAQVRGIEINDQQVDGVFSPDGAEKFAVDSFGGAQIDQNFRAELIRIVGGDVRYLWIADKDDAEQATPTDRSRNAHVTTWDAAPAADRFIRQGSGYLMKFTAASSQKGDVPDAPGLSFVGGAPDEPHSILTLLKVTDPTPTPMLPPSRRVRQRGCR